MEKIDKEQILKAISNYEGQLADKEHFERLRPQFTKGGNSTPAQLVEIKN